MRLLLVTSRFPLPPWRGNQVRTIQWLEALAEHHVEVVCPAGEQNQDLSGLSAAVHTYDVGRVPQVMGVFSAGVRGLPFQEGLYDVPAAARALGAALEKAPWDLVVVQMVRCGWAADLLTSRAPDVPILFDAIDCMGLHFERGGEQFPMLLRPLVALEARRCARREAALARRVELTVAVSQRDLDAIGVEEGKGLVVPVAGREPAAPASPAQRPTVLLSGNLGYRPTAEAAAWFAVEVWPKIRAAVPEARWVVAGARPAESVRALGRLQGVEVHADVPDLGVHLSEAHVAVAPMAAGSGVPMKVLEAWAAGVPVVAHPWTAAGLVDGTENAVRSAETSEQWAEEIVRLLNDTTMSAELGRRGRAAWSQHYSPSGVAEGIREAVEKATSSR